jgi:DNA-binding response OmpR family regulator
MSPTVNAAAYLDDLTNARRALHRMPERGFQEHRTQRYLLDELHGTAVNLDRSVDSHIKNLRKKLEAASGDASGGPVIETVYGVGYRLAIA